MATTLTRAQIAAAVGNDPVTITAFEDLFRNVLTGISALTTGASATKALQDASVLTLSPNDTFTQERVVAAGNGIQLTDTGDNLIIALAFMLILNGGYRLTLNVGSDTDLNIPSSGTVMIKEQPQAVLGNYSNDAAAATAGVPVGGLYQTTGAVKVRVS